MVQMFRSDVTEWSVKILALQSSVARIVSPYGRRGLDINWRT